MVSLSASEILPPIPSGSLTWVLSEKQKSARGQPEPQVDALDDPLWSALTASIRFLIAASSSANSSASWTILSMSSGTESSLVIRNGDRLGLAGTLVEGGNLEDTIGYARVNRAPKNRNALAHHQSQRSLRSGEHHEEQEECRSGQTLPGGCCPWSWIVLPRRPGFGQWADCRRR